jgi:hypothetical protein
VSRSERHHLSPAGQIDQWADFASGLKHNRAGRRRAAKMLGGLVIALVLGVALIYLLG